MTFTDPPSPIEGIHTVELDGELVLFDTTSRRVSHLDRLASLIWPFLDGETTVEELVDDLAAVFEVAREDVRSDLAAMLSALWTAGFLEPRADSEVTGVPSVAREAALPDPPSP